FDELGVGKEGGPAAQEVKDLCFALESKIVRTQILDGEPRIDGRDTRTVRPIQMRVGVLPRTHGSALFTRGETQALVTVTLGTGRDEQIIDALAGEYRERVTPRADMRPRRRRVSRALHASLQHAAVRDRRNRPHGTVEAARDRSRAP